MEYLKVEQPENIKIKLFNHQLTSIYNMENLEKNRNIKISDEFYMKTDIGILGDIPGYGKSYSVLGLISRDKMPWNIEEAFYFENVLTYHRLFKTVKISKIHRIKPNLLLVSNSVFGQWEEYINYTDIKTYYVSTRKELDALIPTYGNIYFTNEQKEKQLVNINDYDLIVVTQTLYNDLVTRYQNRCWKRFIYDDPTTLYIPKMNNIICGFFWMITATPLHLVEPGGLYYNRNASHFMKDFLSSMEYSHIKNMTIKNTEEYIKSSFIMPKVNNFTHKCKKSKILKALSGYVSLEISQMISAGNISGAIKSLGGNMGSNLIEIVGKRKMNDIKLAEHKISFYNQRNDPGDKILVETWEKNLEKYVKDYNEIKRKYKELLSEECVVCADMLKDPILTPCCQNIMCGKCILGWADKKKTCIMCRSSINPKSLTLITKDLDGNSIVNEEKEKEENMSEKPQEMIKLINKIKHENKDAKIILFSDYDETYTSIKNIIKDTKLKCKDILGNIARRKKTIEEFKTGKIDLVFLNSKWNGSGINLQETTDIIIYHSMSQYTTEQILGRALRIGREIDLNLHQFVEI
jgi:superfamily II DNA or RNA helicase